MILDLMDIFSSIESWETDKPKNNNSNRVEESVEISLELPNVSIPPKLMILQTFEKWKQKAFCFHIVLTSDLPL